ncbi:flp pilus-assembly TadE/G-like family protein [Lentzea tibetensis]|uniref:Flp pilus-assembly TadE/G-like family protein n=1 Tax=Lentzea tibetensis TaxID=2591470 RepID=A0A563EUP3_9PSEU|nr:Rv3654c family TadE-like protein [Lentzea tibetensis]TWP51415.1 flp pilus-assembly TadE/G-like family protein [Lentzea tibetensis]
MNDRGSATVSGIAMVAVLLVLVGAGIQFGSAVITRHRVTGAADLAALAGAVHLIDGEQSACDQARRVAERNRARLDECQVSGWDVLIRASADTPFGPVSARSKAGPAEDQDVWGTTSGRLPTVSGLTSGSGHAER